MTVSQLLTAEDVWAMPEPRGKRYELVKGELVEVPGAGMLHGLIAKVILFLLDGHVQKLKLGLVFGDGVGYIIGRDPDTIRVPDVSFVSKDRVPETGIPRGYAPFAPDLAVEIVSPGDIAGELRTKLREYLEAGTRLVWVVWPDDRAVTTHYADGTSREFGPDDELDGGELLPGFTVRVSRLFEVEY